MKRKGILSVLVSILILVLMVSPVFAEGPEKEVRVKDFTLQDGWALLKPLNEALSGPAWLMAENSGAFPADAVFQSAGFGGRIYRSPAPALSRNLLITKDEGVPIQTEPSVAVNPNDPNHLVMASIDYNYPYNSVYTSFDGGETWQGPNRVPLPEEAYGGFGDPVVDFDSKGRAYQVFISGEYRSYPVGGYVLNIPISHIAISSSADGLKWEKARIVDESIFQVIDTSIDEEGRLRATIIFTFLDKPWLSIGPDALNPENDAIYVSYTRFIYAYQLVYAEDFLGFQETSIGTQIGVAVSKNQGKTWLTKGFTELVFRFEDFQPEKIDEELKIRWVQGSQPEVAPDGTVYLTWYDSTPDGGYEGKGQIYLTRSEDGVDWEQPIVAAEFQEGPWKPHTAGFRNPSAFPQMTVGQENEVYIAFAAKTPQKPTDDGDIYFVRSLDGGKTFEKPKQINQDDTNQLQFFPAITTDPTGNLHLMWGDMRDDPAGLKYHIYYTESRDKGESWGFDLPERDIHEPDTRVTDFPSNPNKAFPGGRFIGDYYSIAASDKDVYLVWTDSRLAEYGGINQKIGFARRKAIRSPEVSLNPASSIIDKLVFQQEVTLQIFYFQPDMNIYVDIGGSVSFIGRTNKEGYITHKIHIPVTGEGTSDIVVFDDSGNAAVGSFYMNFEKVFKQWLQKLLQQEKPEQKPSDEQPQKDIMTTRDFILTGLIAVLMVAVGLLLMRRRKKV